MDAYVGAERLTSKLGPNPQHVSDLTGSDAPVEKRGPEFAT